MKTLTLGKDLATNTVSAPRDAKLCEPAPELVIVGDAQPTRTPTNISYRVSVENPTAHAQKICLMPFSLLTSPYVQFSLLADSGLVEPPRLPEVYPRPQEKVSFDVLTLPAHSRFQLGATQAIPRDIYVNAKNLRLSWSVIVNHAYRGGQVAFTP